MLNRLSIVQWGLCLILIISFAQGRVLKKRNYNNYRNLFSDPTSYESDCGPYSVKSGTLNNDAYNDLVVVDQSKDRVSVYIGNGDGTFQCAKYFPTGRGPRSVRIQDVDNDGKQDLIVTNYDDNTIGILFGRGNGNFKLQVPYSVGCGPQSLTVADFNSDGINDIATDNVDDNTVTILYGKKDSYGNVDGTFGNPLTIIAGKKPISIIALDLNNDGKIDIVVANLDDDTVSILINKGSRKFSPPQPYPTGCGPFSVRNGDFDGDGIQDLVTADSESDQVSILFGQSYGGFSKPVHYPAGKAPTHVENPRDFNGDGFLDIAVADSEGKGFTLLFNDGKGCFNKQAFYRGPSGSRYLTAGLFNQDAKYDIALVGFNDDTVAVYLAQNSYSTY